MKTLKDGISRRSFLTSAALLGGSSLAAPGVVNLPFRGSLLASRSATQPNPNFVAGQLIERSSTQLALRVPEFTPDVVYLGLGPGTKMYGRDYEQQWTALELGDRIHSGLRLVGGGKQVATWVIANFVTGWGVVERVEEKSVMVAVMPGMWGIARELYVSPYTHVLTAQREYVGMTGPLARGDDVYFTATGWNANPWVHSVWAYTIHCLQMRT
jgi:hypothetical protein